MRLRSACLLLLMLSGWPTLVQAQTDSVTESKEAARRHLKSGVTLYQSGDYRAALVEFEASYKDHPSASALQNMALCQTKLFRYVEALETLERLEREFGPTLSSEDTRGVTQAKAELSQLVGTVQLQVSPVQAEVQVNDKTLTPEQKTKPFRLSSGEYRVRATAPGYQSTEQGITVAGGEQRQVQITLMPTGAEFTVLALDPSAALAVDGQAMAYRSWSGVLPPGTHLFQAYRPGYQSFSTRVTAKAGDRVELRLPSRGPEPTQTQSQGFTYPNSYLPYVPKEAARDVEVSPQKGWYGLVSATNLIVIGKPDGFSSNDNADNAGGAFGLRLGYRVLNQVALEALFDAGNQSIGGTRNNEKTTADLSTQHYGGNIRYLWGGSTFRLTGGLGVGAVHHGLELEGIDYGGVNSYLMLEAGPQFNVGHVLLEGVLQSYFEGATNVKHDKQRIYSDDTVLTQLGIGLRVGYSQWGR